MVSECVLTTVAPEAGKQHLVGLALYEKLKAIQGHDSALLAFSGGKDALCCWLAMQDHFDVHAYCLELVPGLEFVDESLSRYERHFGCKIMRFPSPSLMRHLNKLTYQSPDRINTIAAMKIWEYDYVDVNEWAKRDRKLPANTLCATGIRMFDSLMRRSAILSRGPISLGAKKWYPVWDWTKAKLTQEITRAGCGVPVDYRMFGRSFDGVDMSYVLPIKKHFPRDYQRIVEMYPMVEVEALRYERYADAKARSYYQL